MTASTVNGRNGCGARAGARTLNLLSLPLNSSIMRALRNGPRKQADLRHATGHPAQTTLRAQLGKLSAEGLVEKQRRNQFPGVLDYELSEAGRDLLAVAEHLERWLEDSPDGPLTLGSPAAKSTVNALTEAWSTTMTRALAAKPLTLTELDRLITALNYPSLERRLSAMRLAGLVTARCGDGRGTPYSVSAWGRMSVAPIVAAARWEHRHAAEESPPLRKLDVEAIFLLAAGLVSPPADVSGSCRLTVELHGADRLQLAGLLMSIHDGRVTTNTTKLDSHADAWITGRLSAWLAAVIERDEAGLELGGDSTLAHGVIDGLHQALFSLPISD